MVYFADTCKSFGQFRAWHTTKWSLNDVAAAVKDVREKKLSVRAVAAAHGIPKSTLFDYASGKVEIGSKRGPDTILTVAEEQMLVDYLIHTAQIGYGRTKEHLCNTVKEILENVGRPNPFKNNRPGTKWWSLFMKRHPTSLRSPEHLQLCRVRCCTPEALNEWYTGFHQVLQTHQLKDQPSHIWNADESGFPLSPKTGRSLQFVMHAVFMESQVIQRNKSLPSVQQVLQVTQYHPCAFFVMAHFSERLTKWLRTWP